MTIAAQHSAAKSCTNPIAIVNALFMISFQMIRLIGQAVIHIKNSGYALAQPETCFTTNCQIYKDYFNRSPRSSPKAAVDATFVWTIPSGPADSIQTGAPGVLKSLAFST